MDSLVLSRYFQDNTRLVAESSPKCGRDYDSVVGKDSEEAFLGFDSADKCMSEQYFQDCKNVYEKNVGDLKECDGLDPRNNCGFSREDVTSSKRKYEKYQSLSRKMYETIAKSLLNDKSSKNEESKGRYRKEDCRKSKRICKAPESSSKYFENAASKCKMKRKRQTSIKMESKKNSVKPTVDKIKLNENKNKSSYFKINETSITLVKTENNNAEETQNVCNKLKHAIKNELKSEHDVDVDSIKFEIKIKTDNVEGDLEKNPNFPDYELQYFEQLNVKNLIKKEETVCWVPPRSPHNLIEEVLYHDPWALLVATIFLNRTACMVARPHIFWFLIDNPNSHHVVDKYPKELEKYFVNLGLVRTRAMQVWRMSCEYLNKKWKDPSELYGIGNYGECAYRMFCLGDFSVQPKDRFLKIYKAWYEKIVQERNF